MEAEEMSELSDLRDAIHDDPTIAKRAKFWADKYVEDRTQTIEEKAKRIQANLLAEFPVLGRKGARMLAHNVTRDWG